jgi:thiamine biosynthesis lipoprotein
MKKKLLALFSGLIILTSCANNESAKGKESLETSSDVATKSEISVEKDKNQDDDLEKYSVNIYDYFDTITTFTAYNKNEEEFKKYEKLVKEEMKKYHELFNSYDEFDGVNNFYTINKMAGVEPVKVDKAIIDLTKEGIKWYEETNGNINIAAGSLLKIWTDFRENANDHPDQAKLPERSELEEAGKHMDISAIEINEEDSTVFIKDKDVQIDIGAIGKGYATELIKQDLIKAGLKHGILSVGGDVALIGDNPARENRKYAIAIQDPNQKDSGSYPSIVDVVGTSVVTSGDYQRFFEIDGRKYHHIVDVNTLEPSTKYKSVTVILEDIGHADALSTALFIEDLEEGKKLAEKYGAEAFWIDHDDKEYRTDGYKNYEK